MFHYSILTHNVHNIWLTILWCCFNTVGKSGSGETESGSKGSRKLYSTWAHCETLAQGKTVPREAVSLRRLRVLSSVGKGVPGPEPILLGWAGVERLHAGDHLFQQKAIIWEAAEMKLRKVRRGRIIEGFILQSRGLEHYSVSKGASQTGLRTEERNG